VDEKSQFIPLFQSITRDHPAPLSSDSLPTQLTIPLFNLVGIADK